MPAPVTVPTPSPWTMSSPSSSPMTSGFARGFDFGGAMIFTFMVRPLSARPRVLCPSGLSSASACRIETQRPDLGALGDRVGFADQVLRDRQVLPEQPRRRGDVAGRVPRYEDALHVE